MTNNVPRHQVVLRASGLVANVIDVWLWPVWVWPSQLYGTWHRLSATVCDHMC